MSSAARFIPNTPELGLERCSNPRRELELALTHIVKNYPPLRDPPQCRGIFKGPYSVAFLFLRLHDLYGDSLIIEGRKCGDWCSSYLEMTQPTPDATDEPDGVVDNAFSYWAIFACRPNHEDSNDQYVEVLCKWAVVKTQEELDSASNEWMNGRAGTLYMLRVLKHYWRENEVMEKLLSRTIEEVVDRIMACPRPWKWHKVPFTAVGAVHGIMGILTQIVLSAPGRARELQPELEEIIDQQRENGMWGIRMPDNGDDRLCQFCHGPPGVVLGLLSIKQYFPEMADKINIAIENGRACIWERGILTKEPCICHGVSGNALALDWERFEKFMSLTTSEKVEQGIKDGTYEPADGIDKQFGLYFGEAGRAWCWAVADKGPEMAGQCIGWNDL